VSEREGVEPALASAALDDVVYRATPIMDRLAAELGGDPRGLHVKTWEEVSYVGGRRGRRDESDAEVG
jgi:hypothetical protein